jgi:hypothetical protein
VNVKSLPAHHLDVGFMGKEAPVVVARVWADSEASVIKSLLENYDIPCHYTSELTNRMYLVPDNSGSGWIRIFVPAALEQEARDILLDSRPQSPLRSVND